MSQVEKRDWKKIVKESNGTLIMAPEKFQDAIREWDKKRVELNKLANAAAKHELETRMILENTILDIRKFLDESGMEGVWLDDIGFETNALKEGEFVITIGKFGKNN